jgi:hypothetical protein
LAPSKSVLLNLRGAIFRGKKWYMCGAPNGVRAEGGPDRVRRT